ncbi:NifU family protein [Fodinisporobacter ferrooxydans]|uniref:NifU family protein n=1 Tax=Fodinisporobacter ferrooxydans TaxID=2901836 RepID=A0ABY4CHI0_9BACL|nr:NifU family protein [Alicyclobacillaceae bacterium MYW30-H2]
MLDRIETVLDKIRPGLEADGGNVEVVEFDQETGVLYVQMQGACGGCPMSTMTLKMGIERAIRAELPEVTEVVAV